MNVCKKLGLEDAPLDTVSKIKTVTDYMKQIKGGSCSVQEFIEWIKREKLY